MKHVRFALVLISSTVLLPALPAIAGEPCCGVVAVDQMKGVATLKDLKTGKTFTVTVKNKATLQKLRVGQKVDRDL